MAKSLKDIIGPRAGRNVSKDEEDILDTLKVDKKEDPAGNKDDVFNATKVPAEATSQKADPGMRHGYRTVKSAEAAYEETVVEQKKKKPLTPEDDRNVNGKDYGYAAGAKGNGSAVSEEEELDEAGVRNMRRAGRTHNVNKNYLMRFNPYSKKSFKDPNEKSKEDSKKETDKLVNDYISKGGKIKKEDVELDEVLKSSDPTSKWIKDFVHSKNPKFAGKSKKERIQQALGAKYAKMREEFEEYLKENDEDYEGEMAKTQLKAMANKAMHLVTMISDNQDLEAWVQSKLAMAKNEIDAVYDYLMYSEPKDNEMEKESAPTEYPMTFPGMNVDTAFGKV